MRRDHLLSSLLLFALISPACSRDEAESDAVREAGPESGLSKVEKQQIQEFWGSFRQAERLRRVGDWGQAVSTYRLALKLDPAHDRSLYHLSNCLIELNRFEEALTPLRELIRVNPLSQRAHLQIGVIHCCPEAGAAYDLSAARDALRRAVEINPEETGALQRLAGVELVRGEEEEARKLYELATRSNHRAVEGYYIRGYLCWKRGEEEQARELLLKVIEQSKKPVMVAGVPGEGDTKEGSRLPPTTVEEKRLIRPFWKGLEERSRDRFDLPSEFRSLDDWLTELRAR